MSYLGKQPATQGKDAGPAVKIDDIASNFNGSVTVFDLAVESTAVNPHPNNLAVYLNGVLQHPGDSYAVSGSQIKFNEAPDTGLSFHGHILGSVRTNTPDEQTVTPSTLHDTTKTLISGSFNKGAVSGSFAQKGAVSASFAQSSAVTASLRSHVLTSALSGSTTLISGSAASTGSFGSIYTDKNVNASAFVGDGSSLTGIDIPTAAAISGSVVSGVSGSATSTGSFGMLRADGIVSGSGFRGWTASSDSRTLDDYEEGTWTPILADDDSDAATHALQGGDYTKIGRSVTLTGRVATSDLGVGINGDIRIRGLPFTQVDSGTNGSRSQVACSYATGFAISAGHNPCGFIELDQAYINLYIWDVTTGTSRLHHTEWTDDGALMFSCVYNADY